MDNPQHYQPLSYALHPPLPPPQSRSPYPSASTTYAPAKQTNNIPTLPVQRENEHEEEEQEDDEEGIVEGQLELPDHEGDRPTSVAPTPPQVNADHSQLQPSITIVQDTGVPVEHGKRRPGRPRGSKNRKPRAPPGSKDAQAASQAAPSGPPPHPDINSQNQQYYEFQWRILNLCAEFYGAAEELVKATNPLVIAQCYHMGPGVKLDPLVMLGEAKRVCDNLLANPSQLVANPPPPMYPSLPSLYSASGVAPTVPGAAPTSTPSAPVITNPQTFVVPLGTQPGYPAPQYPVYAATGQYTANPYYQYPYAPPPGYYPPPQPVASGSGAPAASASHSVQGQTSASGTPAPQANPASSSSGAWADDEVEKLKRLAEESKATNPTGEIDWEHVVRNFGDKRSRHQILIKATNMGLKESSTRGTKRRRENEPTPAESSVTVPTSSPAMGSLQNHAQAASSSMIQNTSSPSHSQHASTPQASPALQNLQRPSSSTATSRGTGTPGPPGSTMPWPIVAAVGAGSPSLPTSTSASNMTGQEPQRTSYYRPRPNQGGDVASKTTTSSLATNSTAHHYMYTQNGHAVARQTDSR